METDFAWTDTGPEELAERFEALPDALVDALASALEDIGVRIRGTAAENAPSDMGQLSSDLGHTVEVAGEQLKVTIGSNLPQAAPMETGTDPFFPPPSELEGWARRVLGDEDAAFAVARSISETGIEGHHYLEDALDEHMDWAVRRLNRAVGEAFESVGFTAEAL